MKRLLLAVFLLPLSALADGGLPTQPYIYVEGKAAVEKPADMVTLRFHLSALNMNAAEANKAVQAKAIKVFKLLAAAKIADGDIVASDLESQAEYEESSSMRSRGKLIGYSVNRPFEVRVRDIAVFPKLVDDLMALGGLAFSSIEEGLTNAKELEDQVWEKAVTNARERADKTLKATGMKVDSVFAVSPVAFPDIRKGLLAETFGLPLDPVAAGPGDVDASQYKLSPVSVRQNVHLIYLISPVK